MANRGSDLQRKLQRALDLAGNTHTIEDVATAVKAGTMQAFHNDDALVITEIVEFPRAKSINVFVACGDLDAVMSLQPLIEDFGRKHGCDRMRMLGRQGWRKVLPKHGWQDERLCSFERKF